MEKSQGTLEKKHWTERKKKVPNLNNISKCHLLTPLIKFQINNTINMNRWEKKLE